MTLLKTKPRWAPTAIATDRGWADPVTGEVYVAIGNLKKLLDAETPVVASLEAATSLITPQPAIELPSVVAVAEPAKEVTTVVAVAEPAKEVTKRKYQKKEKAVNETKTEAKPVEQLNEVTETVLKPDQKIIGEVVEDTAGVKKLIAE